MRWYRFTEPLALARFAIHPWLRDHLTLTYSTYAERIARRDTKGVEFRGASSPPENRSVGTTGILGSASFARKQARRTDAEEAPLRQ